jgi:hypothetical protein
MQTILRISRASAYFFLLFLLIPLVGLTAESRDVGVTITIGEQATTTPSGGGGGGGGGTFGTVTSVVLSGYAYPNAIITYVNNGVVIGTGIADSNGSFLKSFSVPSGLSQFGLWARDTMDFISPTTNIGIYLQPYVPVTISNIVIGPTITGKTVSPWHFIHNFVILLWDKLSARIIYHTFRKNTCSQQKLFLSKSLMLSRIRSARSSALLAASIPSTLAMFRVSSTHANTITDYYFFSKSKQTEFKQ